MGVGRIYDGSAYTQSEDDYEVVDLSYAMRAQVTVERKVVFGLLPDKEGVLSLYGDAREVGVLASGVSDRLGYERVIPFEEPTHTRYLYDVVVLRMDLHPFAYCPFRVWCLPIVVFDLLEHSK